jgi:hypothetical protein
MLSDIISGRPSLAYFPSFLTKEHDFLSSKLVSLWVRQSRKG